MKEAEPTLPSWTHEAIAGWARLWGIPGLAREVAVEPSPRMTHSLGRCYPESRRIRLSECLMQVAPPILREVLCHELAHVAVHVLNGRRSRPHGPAWAGLMRAAGFEPRARLPCHEIGLPLPRKRRRRRRYLYLHRCPVCRMERIARRSMRRWRCAACVESGLDGKLEIWRLPARRMN